MAGRTLYYSVRIQWSRVLDEYSTEYTLQCLCHFVYVMDVELVKLEKQSFRMLLLFSDSIFVHLRVQNPMQHVTF